MSRLEKFIEANRDEFDDVEPPADTWQKVEAAITKKSRIHFLQRSYFKWSAAAAVLLLAGMVTWLAINRQKNIEPIARGKDSVVTDLATLAPADAPEMNQVAKLILVKQEELKSLSKEQPGLYQQFANDFRQLDSSYNTLKNKLSVTPNRELLIEAMIQNLQLQLNVLNQQLNIIQQIKNSKKYSHEKNTTII